ncbi:MAG: hypothetical protein KF699_13450 [Phycisphaeraceae bacterium]|nr:hypothetical protein [Phycisphaeraceae bacterium]MCW5775996.1 hypothetical protein [Phycisphaeraceae bacterium]
MQIVPGRFVRVPNKPPYQHPAASPDYFATRGEVVCGGRRATLDLLFTPTELRRAAHRAQKNREDIPPAKRQSLLALIRRVLGGGER